MKRKDIINHLIKENDRKYNLLKAAEELQELSLVLTQMALKEKKVKDQEVIDEIGDVKIRLAVLEGMFSQLKIKRRIRYKLTKFRSYIVLGKYKGHI